MKRIAVFFPGRKYSVDCPLMYFSDFVCSKHGYDRVFMHYAKHREAKDMTTIPQDIENAKDYVIATLQAREIESYDEVLFVSKSIGTALAGYAREALNIKNVRNIYLTPLPESLKYIEEGSRDRDIVIAGTNDSFLGSETLSASCSKKDIRLYQFEGLGHSLESDDVETTLTTLKEISEIVENFVK